MSGAELLLSVAADFNVTETQVVIGIVPPFQLCKANPLRYALGFQYQGGPRLVAGITDDGDTTNGRNLDVNTLEWMDCHKYGPLPQLAWYAKPNGAANVITVYEIIWNRG